MWLKIKDETYLYTETGSRLQAQPVGAETKARVLYSGPFGNVTVQDGFTTLSDAQDALDSFMTEQGYESISLPETEEAE
jgi:hypothetical protein